MDELKFLKKAFFLNRKYDKIYLLKKEKKFIQIGTKNLKIL